MTIFGYINTNILIYTRTSVLFNRNRLLYFVFFLCNGIRLRSLRFGLLLKPVSKVSYSVLPLCLAFFCFAVCFADDSKPAMAVNPPTPNRPPFIYQTPTSL